MVSACRQEKRKHPEGEERNRLPVYLRQIPRYCSGRETERCILRHRAVWLLTPAGQGAHKAASFVFLITSVEKPPFKFGKINDFNGCKVPKIRLQSIFLEVEADEVPGNPVKRQRGLKSGEPEHIKIVG